MALAAGNINSVWPLLYWGWWQCVTHTHIHGNLASQCHWRLLRWPVSIRDSHQRDIRVGWGERCGWWERETVERKLKQYRGKQSRRWGMIQTDIQQKKKTNCEGQKTLGCKEKKHRWLWVQNWEVGVDLGGCVVLLALFPDTAVCHGPVVIHWYHTWVNNMNKADVIKIGRAPSPPSLSLLLFCSEEKRSTRTANDAAVLLLHSPLLFLLLSNCLSASPPFTHLPFHSPGPRGREAWLSTEAALSKLKGSAEERSRRQTQANKLKEGCIFVCMFCGASATVTLQPTGQHEAT